MIKLGAHANLAISLPVLANTFYSRLEKLEKKGEISEPFATNWKSYVEAGIEYCKPSPKIKFKTVEYIL